METAAEPAQRVSLMTRAWNSLRERRLPWKLRWLKYIQITKPVLTWRVLAATLRNDSEFGSLMLQAYGPRWLAQALDVCRDVGMRPFLAFGTLLGHHRDNGFIKHDADIDLGLLEPDFDKIGLLVEGMLRKGFVIRLNTKREVSFYKPHIPPLLVDFFLFRRKADTIFYQDTRPGVVYEFPWPARVFDELVPVKFMGSIDALVPCGVEEFLEVGYGDWRTPQKEFDNMHGHPNLTVAQEEAEVAKP